MAVATGAAVPGTVASCRPKGEIPTSRYVCRTSHAATVPSGRDVGESAEQDDPGAGAPARPRPVPVHKSVVERDTSLVKHELERDPSGTASAADGGRGEWYVAGPEFIAVAAHVLLREHRELVQV